MSFTKFLMEQQDLSMKNVPTQLEEGGNMGGSLTDKLQAISNQLEEVLGQFQQTLKANDQEWEELTNTTGYFPPKSKVSSGIWGAQREIDDALDHIEHMRTTDYSSE